MQKKDSIVLIGMPAVGKSTIGVILAKILGYHFIDSDIVIQETTGKLLKDLIAQEGTDGFIATENAINGTICQSHAVISTGGSAVYGEEAMAHFKTFATLIYLHADYDTLAQRLDNMKNRGVVFREGQTLKNLYEERLPLYQSHADITIDTKGKDIETVLKEVTAAYEK